MRASRIAALLLLAIAAHGTTTADPTAAAKRLDEPLKAFFAAHCVSCHSGEKPKGNFELEKLSTDFAEKAANAGLRCWGELKAEHMPPPKVKARPTRRTRRARRVDRPGRSGPFGPPTVAPFSAASTASSTRTPSATCSASRSISRTCCPRTRRRTASTTVGEALHVSSFLMEKYLEAADTALNVAIANGPQPPLIKKRYSLKDEHQVKATTEKRVPHLGRRRRALQFVGVATRSRSTSSTRRTAASIASASPPPAIQSAEQAGHVPRRRSAGMRMAGEERPGRLLRRPGRQADRRRVRRVMEPRTTIRILAVRAGRRPDRDTRSGPTSTRGRGWPCSGSRSKGRCTTPGRRRAIAASSATCRRSPSPIYNYRNRVEVVSNNPEADAETDSPRLRPPGVSPRRDRRRRQAVPRPREGEARREAVVRAGGARRPQGGAGVARLPVPPREARQARRLRPGQSAVVLPVEHDARRGTARRSPSKGKLAQPETLRAAGRADARSDPKAAAFTENFVGQWLGLRDIDSTEPEPPALSGIRRHAQGVDGPGDAAVLRRGAEERPEPDELRRLRLHDAQRPAGEALRHPRRRRAGSSAR